eukprot:GFKZ01013781.1.p1 GENE.GFKZ01013781.1~~GFKZ01013781.1.p1  ORF type:complete len:645 (-),score=63.73 GFKZ01013781.1:3495-5429(-)
MGLGNALRRFRGRQAQSDTAPAPPARRKPSKHRDVSTFHERAAGRYDHRSFRSSTYSQSGTGRTYRKQPSREHQNQRQRADQERIVIQSYRSRAVESANRTMLFFPEFDADPQSLKMHIKLSDLKTELHKALESYRAALGRNTGPNIDDIVDTLAQIDKRLAAKPHQIPNKISSTRPQDLEQASHLGSESVADSTRFRTKLSSATSHRPCALDIRPSRHQTTPNLRASSPSRNSINDGSSSSGETYATAMQHAAITADAMANVERVAPSHQYMNGRRNASFRENSNESYMEPASSSQSFATYEELLKATLNDSSSRQKVSVEPKSSRMKHQEDRESPQPLQGHYYQKSSSIATRRESQPAEFDWSRGPRSPVPVPDDVRDDGNSESGDEGPLHLVSSRTSNSLHQKAESARTGTDTRYLADFPATDMCQSSSGGVDRKHSQPGGAIRPSDQPLNKEPPSSKATTMGQPMLTATNNMSFASSLYQTRNARVGSINDTGIFLRRSNVRGDGRCLFRALVRCRAIAKGLPIPVERAEREEADILRGRAIEELIKHQELLDRFFVIEGDFVQYLRKMSHPRTYGGEPELLMLAKVLHVPIAVYVLKGQAYRQIQVYGKQYQGEPLRILYSDGVHYDSLIVAMRTSRHG